MARGAYGSAGDDVYGGTRTAWRLGPSAPCVRLPRTARTNVPCSQLRTQDPAVIATAVPALPPLLLGTSRGTGGYALRA